MEYHYIEKRYNVIGLSSIDAFAGVKGGMNGNCKDVYFLRVMGANGTFAEDIERMDAAQTGRMRLGQAVYNRVGAFPGNVAAEMVSVYTECYEKWEETGRTRLFTRRLGEESGAGELLGASCGKVLEVYRRSNPGMSASIEKNFVVKLMFWLDEMAYEYLKEWNPRQSMKFVAQGVVKEQEYLFCYLLTLLGIDVLLLQNEADIDGKADGLNLSKKLVLGEKRAVALGAYDRRKYGDRQEDKRDGSAPSQGGGQVRAQAAPMPGQRPKVVIPPRRGAAGAHGAGSVSGGGAQGAGSGSGSGAQGASGGVQDVGGISGSGEGRTQGAGSVSGGGVQDVGGISGSGVGRTQGAGGVSGGAARGIGGVTSGGVQGAGSGVRGAHAAPTARRELDFEELALRASSVVMITIHDRTGEIAGSGSGIMIGREGYILTNNHVASGGMFYSVRIENDDNVYKTNEIIKYNSLLDLAVIRIDRLLDPLPVYGGGKPLVRGQKVVAIGSPLGLFNSVSDGIISGFRKMNDVEMIQFTAPTSHGSSGGALLNMYGEVIGVSTAGIDEGQNINLAVGYEFINTFARGFR